MTVLRDYEWVTVPLPKCGRFGVGATEDNISIGNQCTSKWADYHWSMDLASIGLTYLPAMGTERREQRRTP